MKLRFTPEKWAYLKPLFVAMTTRLSKKGSLIHDAARDPKQEFRNVASESARRMPTRSEKKFRNVARETAARNPREEFRNVATVVPAIKHAGRHVEKGNETLRAKNESESMSVAIFHDVKNEARDNKRLTSKKNKGKEALHITLTHPKDGFSKAETTKRYGNRDSQYGGNRSQRLDTHHGDRNRNDEDVRKNNLGWQRSGLDQRVSKIQICKDLMSSYTDLIVGPETNNVAHGGALPPDRDDASTEHS